MPRTDGSTSQDGRADSLPEPLIEEALRLWGETLAVNIGIRIEHWERYGLTTGQLRLMSMLREATEPLPLGELAQRLNVSPATITGITTRLVRRHLIERVADPSDRRVIRAALTDEGERALQELNQHARARLVELFTRLGEERTAQLVSLLGEWVQLGEELRAEEAAAGADGVAAPATVTR